MMVRSDSLSPLFSQEFLLPQPETFKAVLRAWIYTHDPAVYFDSNGFSAYPYQRYEALAAVGNQSQLICANSAGAFAEWQTWQQKNGGWQFGFLSYELKNDVEDLASNNPDHLDFPALYFFEPEIVVEVLEHQVIIHSANQAPEKVWEAIWATPPADHQGQAVHQKATLQARLTKEEYLQRIQQIRQHIEEGDVYELNFCQEFYLENTFLDPMLAFEQLNALGKAPFSSYVRIGDRYLLCASPERFLAKRGDQLISQPIKGTRPRHADAVKDRQLAEALFHSEKDRAENVMIVDLVRNDLARSCTPGSVQVEELFGIYSFAQVHQMISTIVGKLRPEISLIEAIKKAFPMGSMTGAPKVMSMELIDHYETARRGLFSGAVGYIRPDGDADFNVVIRSLLYNAQGPYLSFQVGGAIVYDSTPEEEYQECLVKAQGMLATLGLASKLD